MAGVSALWYLGRGTGVVAAVLLTLVVALGIATRGGRPLPGLPAFAVGLVHRNAALLSICLLVVHVTTLLSDPYAQLRLVDLVFPFVGSYRPFWQGMGTLAFDLILLLVLTSLLRRRIGVRAWKAIHWTAYAAWPLAMLHLLGNGTDSGTLWLRLTALGCAALVGVAVARRSAAGFGVPDIPAVPAAVAAPRTGIEALR